MNSENKNIVIKYIERANPQSFWQKIFECNPADTDLAKGANSATALAIENALNEFDGEYDAQILGFPYQLILDFDDDIKNLIRKKLIGAALIDIAINNNKKFIHKYEYQESDPGLIALFANMNEVDCLFNLLDMQNIIDILPNTDFSQNACPYFLINGSPSIKINLWEKTIIKSLLELLVKKHLISLINDEKISMLDVGVYHPDVDFTPFLGFADAEDRFRMNEILNEYSQNENHYDLEASTFYKTMIQNMYLRLIEGISYELKSIGFNEIRSGEYVIQFENTKQLKPFLIRLLGDHYHKVLGFARREVLKNIDIRIPFNDVLPASLVIIPPNKTSIRYFNENFGGADYNIIMPEASKINEAYSFEDGVIFERLQEINIDLLINDLKNNFNKISVQ